MKLAVIAPTGLLVKYCRSDYHLALAHMMDDEKYVRFYRDTARGYVMLDNSVIELGDAVDLDFLTEAIVRFQPREVVIPDVPGSHDETFENARTMGPILKEQFPDLKLQVVPQAEDGGAVCFVKSMMKFLQIPEVDTIGIPKSLKQDRLSVLSLIDKDRPTRWKYHMLGTWGNPIEIELARMLHGRWLRGVDSKIPVRLGLLGVALHPTYGMMLPEGVRYQLPDMSFDVTDDPFPVIVDYNIRTMQGWLDGTESTVRQLWSVPLSK